MILHHDSSIDLGTTNSKHSMRDVVNGTGEQLPLLTEPLQRYGPGSSKGPSNLDALRRINSVVSNEP
jgi:hypothetical protein